MARTFVATPIFLMLVVLGASAQGHVDELRSRLEARFEIVPIANGIVLTPRFRTSVKSVELSGVTIAINGATATGPEVRERLGNDADLVLQASYLDADARRLLAAGKTPPAPAADPTPSTTDGGSMDRRDPDVRRAPRTRQR